MSETRPIPVLAIETSGDVCGVALLRGGLLLVEHTFRHEMHLSERLMQVVDFVLKQAGLTLPDIEGFAVGVGPGSFTGTRIGVMTAKTWAALFGKPVVGIDSLMALAASYSGLLDTVVVPLLPCRKDVVYTCPFVVNGPFPDPAADPAALTLDELTALLVAQDTRRVLLCGPARERYGDDLAARLQSREVLVYQGSGLFPRASDVGHLALLRLESDLPLDDPLALVPLYISPPPITLPKGGIPGAAPVSE